MQVCEKNNGVMINAAIKIIKLLAYTSLENVHNVGALWKIRKNIYKLCFHIEMRLEECTQNTE